MPSWNHTTRGRAARMSSTCGGMSCGRRKTLTMSIGAGHVAHRAVDRPAEDARDVGIVDRHRHDVVAGPRHVLGHVERGLVALRLGLDAEHRDALALADDARDASGSVTRLSRQPRSWPSLAPVLASAREEPHAGPHHARLHAHRRQGRDRARGRSPRAQGLAAHRGLRHHRRAERDHRAGPGLQRRAERRAAAGTAGSTRCCAGCRTSCSTSAASWPRRADAVYEGMFRVGASR